MAITPNDQTRQFDYDRGVPRSILTSLAAPPATAVTAETRADTLTKNGKTGSVAPDTDRPKSGSNWIAGGAVGGYGTVAAGTNPAPPGNAQRDAIREAQETASVAGNPAPVVSAAAPTGTSPTASVVLTWGGVPGATGYTVEKSVKSGAAWGAWGAGVNPSGSAVTATQTGLSTGQVRFRVTAVGAKAPVSDPVVVTIP